MKHKEYGSEFYKPIEAQWCLDTPNDSFFISNAFSLFFSGRAALYHLLDHGITNLGWKELYLPSYYCHEVFRFIESLPIRIHYYAFNPLFDSEIRKESIPDRDHCVLISVSFFGMQCADTSHFDATIVIEDLTHSLASVATSQAHYCFGSLRKELPLPVGGFLYAPGGEKLPQGMHNDKAASLSEQKLDAMQMKYDYLMGHHDDKAAYRDAFAAAEHEFESTVTRAALPRGAADLLAKLDVKAILLQKKINLGQALDQLSNRDGVTLFESAIGQPTFGLVLHLTSGEKRDALARYLIDRSIYPAVLWPDQKLERDRALEDTLLFVHTDFRYDAKDIVLITQTIRSFFDHE